MSDDPYLYPDTQTLKNNNGIHDSDRLEEVERVLSRLSIRQPLSPLPAMTPEGLQQIHRHIFGRVYPWAGEFRTIGIEKIVTGDKTVAFERGPFVKPAVARFFGELNADNCLRGLDAKTFAFRAAVYMEDLNFIHPFREGNGRAQRLFLECLAHQAGHTLDQARIDERGWMDGSIQSFRQPVDGTHDIMTRTIEQALTDSNSKESTRSDAVARAIERVKKKEERDAENTRDPDNRGR